MPHPSRLLGADKLQRLVVVLRQRPDLPRSDGAMIVGRFRIIRCSAVALNLLILGTLCSLKLQMLH